MRIAILDDYQNVALRIADWSSVRRHGEFTVFNDHVADPRTVVERLRPCDVVCVMRERTPLIREILQQLSNLKPIASTGPRNASIDTQTAADLGIAVTATGYGSTPTIELTWSLTLASICIIDREAASLRAGGWQTGLGSNLRGKSLGVVGLGNIGSEVARIGVAFGMKVIAWSQNQTEEKAIAATRMADWSPARTFADSASIARNRGINVMSRRDVPVTAQFGRFLLDAHRHELLADGAPVRIGSRALDVLIVLTAAKGDLVTKHELMSRVWPGAVVEENTLQFHISVLRKALGPDCDFIKTISGRGYRFIAHISTPADPGAASLAQRHDRPPSTNPPAPPSDLIGSEAILAELADLVAAHRLATPAGREYCKPEPDRALSFGGVCCRNSLTARGSPPWGRCPALSLFCPPSRPCWS